MLYNYGESKDVTVYINDTFYRLQNSNYSGEEYFFEKEAAVCFKTQTDFNIYKCAHKIDKHLGVLFCYQKINGINFYLN